MKRLYKLAQFTGIVLSLTQSPSVLAQTSGRTSPWQTYGRIEKAGVQFSYAAVTLNDGNRVYGPVVLHSSADVLILSSTNRTVPAVQVHSFEVRGQLDHVSGLRKCYDFTLMRQGYYPGNPSFSVTPEHRRFDEFNGNLKRVYGTYYWNRGNEYDNYLVPGFFEVLSNGPVVLLYRTSLGMVQNMSSSTWSGRATPNTMAESGAFYLGLADGRAVALRNPYSDILNMYQAQAAQLATFVKENRLSCYEGYELAYLINYANSLAQAAFHPQK
ncbi:hypothetical protein [Hymenobacter wooponensis]|uniref:Uncharacterized protein n=1 Tax=Hymenobacter wooponensis TaxID=1525360 RepID=A0A4Z0ML74_9BACT|nr:hypothetical protein [Hymenobacter wooponensis]TGD80513.1 hypothetical protein EU557_11810 [Hymenobacter wooponensis]